MFEKMVVRSYVRSSVHLYINFQFIDIKSTILIASPTHQSMCWTVCPSVHLLFICIWRTNIKVPLSLAKFSLFNIKTLHVKTYVALWDIQHSTSPKWTPFGGGRIFRFFIQFLSYGLDTWRWRVSLNSYPDGWPIGWLCGPSKFVFQPFFEVILLNFKNSLTCKPCTCTLQPLEAFSNFCVKNLHLAFYKYCFFVNTSF